MPTESKNIRKKNSLYLLYTIVSAIGIVLLLNVLRIQMPATFWLIFIVFFYLVLIILILHLIVRIIAPGPLKAASKPSSLWKKLAVLFEEDKRTVWIRIPLIIITVLFSIIKAFATFLWSILSAISAGPEKSKERATLENDKHVVFDGKVWKNGVMMGKHDVHGNIYGSDGSHKGSIHNL